MREAVLKALGWVFPLTHLQLWITVGATIHLAPPQLKKNAGSSLIAVFRITCPEIDVVYQSTYCRKYT